jgi:ParB family chromosome partitioning protein
MAKKFDLASAIAEMTPQNVSNLDTSPTVTMIPLDDLIGHKDNREFSQEDLRKLADMIAMDGLHQYPLVMPHPEQAGKYLILSGHRRCAAIRLLVEDPEHPREDLRMVPCTVREYRSEALAKLALIADNTTIEPLTSAQLMQQAEETELLLYQLAEEGYEFPGRMRDQVAAACKTSASKLARLKVIRENLIPEYLKLFQRNELPERTAYALARMPIGLQSRLFLHLTNPPSGAVSEQLLAKATDGWDWKPTLTCPDGQKCHRGDIFLYHDITNPFDMCGGKTCCLDCPKAQVSCCPCARMCSKAKEARKIAREIDHRPPKVDPPLEETAAEVDQRIEQASCDRMASEMQISNARISDLSDQVERSGWHTGPIPEDYVGWLVVKSRIDEHLILPELVHRHDGGLYYEPEYHLSESKLAADDIIRWCIVPEDPDDEQREE